MGTFRTIVIVFVGCVMFDSFLREPALALFAFRVGFGPLSLFLLPPQSMLQLTALFLDEMIR